jgi:hypothetical protein
MHPDENNQVWSSVWERTLTRPTYTTRSHAFPCSRRGSRRFKASFREELRDYDKSARRCSTATPVTPQASGSLAQMCSWRWAGESGAPVANAPHLRKAPLAGVPENGCSSPSLREIRSSATRAPVTSCAPVISPTGRSTSTVSTPTPPTSPARPTCTNSCSRSHQPDSASPCRPGSCRDLPRLRGNHHDRPRRRRRAIRNPIAEPLP